MASGKTLGAVLNQAVIEAGLSTQDALNIDARESLKGFIVTEEERLIDDFQWLPFADDTNGKFYDTALVAGERYYDWPAGFDYKTLAGVWYDLNGVWLPLNYGITPADYSSFNPENDVRSEPTQKWDFHTEAQFEVWPLPIENGNTIRMQGRALHTAPTSESQVCVLDHIMLAKFAAAAFIRRRPDESGEQRRLADRVYAEASGRLTTLKARRNRHQRINFTRGRMPDAMDPRFRILVAR